MLSTSTVWGRATHTTDPSSGRLCVHTRLTADLIVPRYSACDLNQHIPPSAHKAFTSKTRHVWSRSNEWQRSLQSKTPHTHTHTHTPVGWRFVAHKGARWDSRWSHRGETDQAGGRRGEAGWGVSVGPVASCRRQAVVVLWVADRPEIHKGRSVIERRGDWYITQIREI